MALWGDVNGWEQPRVLQFGGSACLSPHSQISEYARAIEDQDSQVLEINGSPNSRDPTALSSSYESPAFNLLRLELEGAQGLVAQLKAKEMSGRDGDFLYQLQSQVCGLIKESLTPPKPPALSNLELDNFPNHFFLGKKTLS